MPLSSVLGAQSLVRPGVCTSSTRPASPFEGQLIFETDTNRVVAYDGSAWVYAVDTDQPPGLQLVKTQTIGTAVSTVTVSDAFSADFDNYRVVFTGGTASATNNFNIQLGSTATGYYWSFTGTTYANAATKNAGANTTSWVIGEHSTDNYALQFDIIAPQLAKYTLIQSYYVSATTTGSGGVLTGYLNNVTQYTAFTVTPGSGTITGGTIRVYGYRNS